MISVLGPAAVLDLSFIAPASAAVAILLLRRRPLGFVLGPPKRGDLALLHILNDPRARLLAIVAASPRGGRCDTGDSLLIPSEAEPRDFDKNSFTAWWADLKWFRSNYDRYGPSALVSSSLACTGDRYSAR